MSIRAQAYRVTWPLTPSQVEGIDEMLAALFKAIQSAVLVTDAEASAPTATAGVAITNHYGTSATNFLGTPNAWLEVDIQGTTYKIPLYT